MAGAELMDVHRRWPVAAGNGRRESIPVSWWNQVEPAGWPGPDGASPRHSGGGPVGLLDVYKDLFLAEYVCLLGDGVGPLVAFQPAL